MTGAARPVGEEYGTMTAGWLARPWPARPNVQFGFGGTLAVEVSDRNNPIHSPRKLSHMTKRSPRAFALAATGLALVAVLAACSSGTPSGSSSASKGKLKTITFVNPLPDDPQWKEIGKCMSDEAAKKGLTYTQSGPTGGTIDQNYMLDRLNQAISDKINAIVTFPLTPAEFDPLFKKARASGALVASIEGTTSPDVDVNVGSSFEEFGEAAAKTIASIGGDQNVGIITDGPTGPPKTFVDSFTAYVKAHPEDHVKLESVQYNGGDPTKVQGIAQAMLTAHPDLTVFLTNQAPSTAPLVATLTQKNLKGKVFIVTNSKYSGGDEGIKSGYIYSTLLQNLCAMGTESVDALVKISNGEKVPANIATELKYATIDNIDALTKSGEMS